MARREAEQVAAAKQANIRKSEEKVEKMEKQIDRLTVENAQLEADKARFAAMAQDYQTAKAKGVPAHLIMPSPAPSPAPIPAPSPGVDVQKLLEAWQATLESGEGNGARTGRITAAEGPYIVQHIGMGRHVCTRLAEGVKAPPVGTMATIRDGQVVEVQVPERGRGR
jgi:hypothetical protein